MNKEDAIARLLNEAARSGLHDTGLRDVVLDYFTLDSDRVLYKIDKMSGRPRHDGRPWC